MERRGKNIPVAIDRRRGERRRDSRARVVIWVEESTDEAIYYHYSTNISSHGIFLENKLPLPVDTKVVLEIKAPDGSSGLTLKGVVKNIRVDQEGESFQGMGVAFVDLSDDQHEEIKTIIAKISLEREDR